MVTNISLKDKPTTKGKALMVERVPFIKQAGLSSLSQLAACSETDIIEICTQFPKGASQLIIDLFADRGLALAEVGKLAADKQTLQHNLLTLQTENGKLQDEIARLKGEAA